MAVKTASLSDSRIQWLICNPHAWVGVGHKLFLAKVRVEIEKNLSQKLSGRRKSNKMIVAITAAFTTHFAVTISF